MEQITASILLWSAIFGVDPAISLSVAKVESNFNPNTVGSVGEIGIYQLRPEYVEVKRELLFNPSVNIMLGIKRISEEREKCTHKSGLTFLVCYNYGRGNAKKVKNPSKFPYVVKVTKEIGVINGFRSIK
jgi:soluble lytic murein transglycosylase-like protein